MWFKKDFVWGAPIAAYQVEGAWDAGGKGLSIWDEFCITPGKIWENQTGDLTSDHYHRWENDIALSFSERFSRIRLHRKINL